MPSSSFVIATGILALASCIPSILAGYDAPAAPTSNADAGQTLHCKRYYPLEGDYGKKTICNEDDRGACYGKCTGVVVAKECAPEGTFSPRTTESCTISFGRGTARSRICRNEKGSFDCFGESSGFATCTKCIMNNSTTSAHDAKGSGAPDPSPASPTTGATPTDTPPTTGPTPTDTPPVPGAAPTDVPPATGTSGNGTSSSTSESSRMAFAGQVIATVGLITVGIALI